MRNLSSGPVPWTNIQGSSDLRRDSLAANICRVGVTLSTFTVLVVAQALNTRSRDFACRIKFRGFIIQ